MALQGLSVDALIYPLVSKKCRSSNFFLITEFSFIYFVQKVCLLIIFLSGWMLSSVADEIAEKGSPVPTTHQLTLFLLLLIS